MDFLLQSSKKTAHKLLFGHMYKFLLLAAIPLIAEIPSVDFSEGTKKIGMQNSILAKVNGTTFSMMDVKKKMDMVFYQHYPQLSQNNAARCQFYDRSWRQVLMEMIDHELILADAAEKEVKVSDADIRETLESRFGPNVLATLDAMNLTYDEAWKLLKNDLIVQRMSWWFIQAKAMQSVTPQLIRKAYQKYLQEHPSYEALKYRIVSLRKTGSEIDINEAYQLLIQSGKSPEMLVDVLHAIDPSIQISSEFSASNLEISDSHWEALAGLSPGSYSSPMTQTSRSAQQTVTRIFYLSDRTSHPAPTFQDLSQTLRDELVQKAAVEHSQKYLSKLRKHFGFDTGFLNEQLPENLHPFFLQ